MLLVTDVDLYVLVRHPWLLMFEVEGNGPILLHGVPLMLVVPVAALIMVSRAGFGGQAQLGRLLMCCLSLSELTGFRGAA